MSVESWNPQYIVIPNGDPGVVYAIVPENRNAYACGDDGSVWTQLGKASRGTVCGIWRPLKQQQAKSGHFSVGMRPVIRVKITRWVHQLILEAFVGPCPAGMECRHKDGLPWRNVLANLEWNTKSVNTVDRVRHGIKSAFGEGHPHALFTDDQVIELRRRASCGDTARSIAAELSISERAVRKAIRGVTYSHLPGAVQVRKSPCRLSVSQVEYIRSQVRLGRSQSDVASELQLPHYVVSKIVNNKTWNGVRNELERSTSRPVQEVAESVS